jgi:hypothetical protein
MHQWQAPSPDRQQKSLVGTSPQCARVPTSCILIPVRYLVNRRVLGVLLSLVKIQLRRPSTANSHTSATIVSGGGQLLSGPRPKVRTGLCDLGERPVQSCLDVTRQSTGASYRIGDIMNARCLCGGK